MVGENVVFKESIESQGVVRGNVGVVVDCPLSGGWIRPLEHSYISLSDAVFVSIFGKVLCVPIDIIESWSSGHED